MPSAISFLTVSGWPRRASPPPPFPSAPPGASVLPCCWRLSPFGGRRMREAGARCKGAGALAGAFTGPEGADSLPVASKNEQARKMQMAEASFPLNAWYAAAWGHEVARDLNKRTVCAEDIVLFRQQDGAVAALEDACWHRLMPLSLGTLEGDTVVCGYHGLRFNGAGRCTFMPAQKTINPSAGVRRSRRSEKHRLVWLWPGDPALADPATSPTSTGTTARPTATVGGRGRHVLRPEMRLPPGARQPDGPDARDLRARRVDRRRRDHRHAVRRDAHRPHRDGDALDARHRSAAVLGQASGPARAAGRPLADHPLPGAEHDRGRRRRGADRHRRARGRPQPGRQRLLPGRDHAGDARRAAITSGTSSAPSSARTRR